MGDVLLPSGAIRAKEMPSLIQVETLVNSMA
jgi:hypothetical protein